jgi:hypothetical protein
MGAIRGIQFLEDCLDVPLGGLFGDGQQLSDLAVLA